MNKKKLGILIMGTVLTVGLSAGCGKNDGRITVKDDTTVENQEDDILSLTDYVQHITDSTKVGENTYEAVDSRYLVKADEKGNREIIQCFETDIQALERCNLGSERITCIVRVADEDNSAWSRIYRMNNEETAVVPMYTCPVRSFEITDRGDRLVQFWNGRYFDSVAATEKDIWAGNLPEDRRIGVCKDAKVNQRIITPTEEQIAAYLDFCGRTETYVSNPCNSYAITPDGRLLDASGKEYPDVNRAMPGTLYESDGMVFYADQNVIHRMKPDGSDNQVLYVAEDIVYEMQGTSEYAFFAAGASVCRLHIPSGIMDEVVPEWNAPYSIRVKDNLTVELYDNRSNDHYYHDYKGIQEELTCLQKIVTEEDLQQGIVCASYEYEGVTYVAWFEQKEYIYLSVGRQFADGKIQRLSHYMWGRASDTLTVDTDDLERFSMQGGDDYAYIHLFNEVCYVDYVTGTMFPIATEVCMTNMKVYDQYHVLLQLYGYQTVYATLKLDEKTESGVLSQSDTLTGEMKKAFPVTAEPITTYEGYDMETIVPEGEQVWEAMKNRDGSYLFLITEKSIYRYSCEDATCIRLEGEVPPKFFWCDILEDDTVTLTEVYFSGPTGKENCFGIVTEGFLGYGGREIHFGLPQ